MLIGKILAIGTVVVLVLFGINYLANSIAIGTATVVDGDTLQIGDKIVTFDGADAVEFDQLCTFNAKKWPCGKHAARALENYVIGKTVTCRPTGEKRGDRKLARCFVGTDVDLAKMQVRAGWALSVPTASVNYSADEQAARGALLGIWSSIFLPPWQWAAKPKKDVIP